MLLQLTGPVCVSLDSCQKLSLGNILFHKIAVRRFIPEKKSRVCCVCQSQTRCLPDMPMLAQASALPEKPGASGEDAASVTAAAAKNITQLVN